MKTLQEWDSTVDWYDQNMGAEGDPLNRNIIKPLVLKMMGDISSKSILDSGCGSGYFTSELAKMAMKVTGTDFSHNFVELCKKKYKDMSNLDFVQHDVTKKMSFQDNEFNVILSKMVLQYVFQIQTFAEESYRVLSKSGELIIIVDHPFNSQFYFAQQVSGKPSDKYPNLKDYFSKEEQTKLSLWGKTQLTWYPKTIGDYILPFVKAGLNLVDFIEQSEENDGVKIPRILALKFRR